MSKKILLGLLIVVLIGFGALFSAMKAADKAMAGLTIHDVNLTSVADGQYVGDYDAKMVYAKVQVTVQNHTIKAIDILEHRNDRGTAGEKVTASIIARQSLLVDAVSGATDSSKVITKAVEVALGNTKK